MSNPSLLCVPYRFKTSKLYSQIPDSGLGDFTVTRSASNAATRVNAAGLIETVADNVPRLDYPLGGITAGCPALLVEPSAQNLCLQSANFGTTWTISNSTQLTTNVSATLDPAGGTTADLIFCQASGTTSQGFNQSISITTSGTYTMSVFVKKATNFDWFRLQFQDGGGTQYQAYYNLVSGTLGAVDAGSAATITNYGNGWYRITHSRSTAIGTIVIGVRLASANSQTTVVCDGNSGTYTWGAQVETGSVATSYIPTTTAPVTRGADVVSKTGASSLIGQTEGTMYCEFAYFGRPIDRSGPLYLRQSSLRGMSINSDSIGTGIVFGSRNDGGSTFVTLVPGTLQLGTYYKIAIGYDAGNTPAGGQQANGVVAYVNGVQVATGTLRVPDVAISEFRMYSANSGNDTEIPNVRIRAHALYPTRLTNAQLQALTT